MNKRKSVIRKAIDEATMQEMFIVDLYENDKLVQTRHLPGKSYYFAEDVAFNWESGVIRLLNEA